MIIAHIARTCYPFHGYGGLEQHVYHLTLELARLGHTVHLFTAPPSVQQTAFKWPEGVQHHFVKYDTLPLRHGSIAARLTNYPLFAYRVARAVRQLPVVPDIIHAHGLSALGYNPRRFPHTPLVLNPHGMEEFKVSQPVKRVAYAPFRAGLRGAAKKARAVIATDATLVPEIERFLRVAPAKIALIPNAVDLQKFAVNSLAKSPNDRFTMLSVGRLEANKGFDVLVRALAQAKNALPPGWSWVLVGDGSQRANLERAVTQAALTAHVTFAGAVDDTALAKFYRQADLFVHPTLYEGSSLVTLEAMAHGLPVVASNTGGIPDKVFASGEFENGRLSRPGDAADLAEKLCEISHWSAEERARLGANGRHLVEMRFSWQAAARQTEELYLRIQASE